MNELTSTEARDGMKALAKELHALATNGQRLRAERGRELGLGNSDLTALDLLYSEGSMAPKELRILMGVTSGTMTGLLDRVEKNGFLRRDPNPEDRRGLLISLTPAGLHAMEWLYEKFEDAVLDVVSRLAEQGVERSEKFLAELNRSLEAAIHAAQSPEGDAGKNPKSAAEQRDPGTIGHYRIPSPTQTWTTWFSFSHRNDAKSVPETLNKA
ncbi:MarR family winged helix-turn-helix transcriptional regulator [Arthrobacter sp. SDTb3-6]|uniref:MarR family winged helix-turn-helix transcriptional regulator n=1 Tax=Arthrobacter sp. SDTb3-6 TaxID=2713571 RepID=UPI00159E9222|nr:MarR family transcriptional regulator [Arthrobacter sp. SDTb3-6]NVN00080.1 MarR family transcriptional regulator [Arthrobacter sp. SDTb3-6]